MIPLSSYNDQGIRALLHSGEIFEGQAQALPAEYCLHEYGREEEALQFGANDDSAEGGWLLYQSEIREVIPLESAAPELLLHFACGDDFVTTRWAGGSTTQFLIMPREAVYGQRDFLWRISSATVELPESEFTPLPDYIRYITPLEGSMSLTRNEGEPLLLKPYDILRFDGADSTHSIGKCRDFNLMLRKDDAKGNLRSIALHRDYQPLPLQPGMQDILLFCPEGDCHIQTPWSEILLPAGEILIGENLREIPLSARSHSPARLLLAQAGKLSLS